LIILGCISMITIGLYLNFEYYQTTIHPLNLTDDRLDEIIASSDLVEINDDLMEVKDNLVSAMKTLPQNKNPVWLFGTESTNFLKIESDVNNMIVSMEKISFVPKDSSAYHAGILDIHDRADMIGKNIVDAKGFLYASATNMFFTLVWTCGIIGLIIMRTKK